MNLQDIKSLKYFIACGLLIISFFAYSGMVGWKWFNPTSTTHERGDATHRVHGGNYYRYHK